MTDETIERALFNADDIAIDECVDCSDVYNYIKRLKERIEDMYAENQNLQTYIDNHEEIWKHNAEIAKKVARKETAKDILQAITKNNKAMGVDDCFLCELAEEYGVEVGDD